MDGLGANHNGLPLAIIVETVGARVKCARLIQAVAEAHHQRLLRGTRVYRKNIALQDVTPFLE